MLSKRVRKEKDENHFFLAAVLLLVYFMADTPILRFEAKTAPQSISATNGKIGVGLLYMQNLGDKTHSLNHRQDIS
jgi:hypothetical protein